MAELLDFSRIVSNLILAVCFPVMTVAMWRMIVLTQQDVKARKQD